MERTRPMGFSFLRKCEAAAKKEEDEWNQKVERGEDPNEDEY